MYLPKAFEEARLPVLHQLIRSHPLGTWVSVGATELDVHHIPFLSRQRMWRVRDIIWACRTRKSDLEIRGRCAAGRRDISRTADLHHAFLVFEQGSAREGCADLELCCGGGARAAGIHPRSGWLHAHLRSLSDKHEAAQALPWSVDDAPADYIQKLIAAVVGIAIPIQRIEGKWKTSQNRQETDKMGVVTGLLAKGDEEARAMASLVRDHIKG